jgi:hypothetical protein
VWYLIFLEVITCLLSGKKCSPSPITSCPNSFFRDFHSFYEFLFHTGTQILDLKLGCGVPPHSTTRNSSTRFLSVIRTTPKKKVTCATHRRREKNQKRKKHPRKRECLFTSNGRRNPKHWLSTMRDARFAVKVQIIVTTPWGPPMLGAHLQSAS